MAYSLPQSIDDEVPSIVLIGVRDRRSLEKVICRLQHHHIEFSSFSEDEESGVTAIATVPLVPEQRVLLQNYKLWNEKDALTLPLSSVVRAPSSEEDGGRLFESVSGNQYARVARLCSE